VKILVISNLYPPDVVGGYELICGQMVDALRARGHTVCVLTSHPRRGVEPAGHVRRTLQRSDFYDSGWMNTAITRRLCEVEAKLISAQNVHSLLLALDEVQPDAVLLYNLLGLGGLGLLGCLRHLRVPWVWHIEDPIPRVLCSLVDTLVINQFEGEPVPALVRELNRQLRGTYLACSLRVVHEIEECGLVLRDRVDLVPNWVCGPRPAARTSYLQDGKLRIVSAGIVSPHKGSDVLIKAAAQLRDWGYDQFSIDLYGEVMLPDYQALIDHLGLRDHVVLKGKRSHPELMACFGDYDVFAFPTSEGEAFGLAPLEAAAAGCVPVISSRCGVAEWLVGGVHCFKAERTAQGFASLFRDFLNCRLDLEPVGRRAAAVVWRDFHIDTVVPRFEEALARVARQPRTGAGTAKEAYDLALLAERSARVLVHETVAA
jgi:glycosyltransferase involved in cell wall biosynthesis